MSINIKQIIEGEASPGIDMMQCIGTSPFTEPTYSTFE